MKRNVLAGISAASAMLILILDSQTALRGAAEGLGLCVRSVVPSLFPFLFLSTLLTGAVNGASLPFLRPIGRLCGIPAGAESLLLAGLLGGYPVGAKSITQMYLNGQLNRKDAQRMLGFCSNCGPSFIFGIIGPQFAAPGSAWILWGIHIASALVTGMLLPGRSQNCCAQQNSHISCQNALRQAIAAMAQICGWVVLFRVLLSFLERWFLWLFPAGWAVLLTGILELTNGCLSLSAVSPEELRVFLASIMLSVGGLCVCMQTVSVTEGLGLGMYLPGKLLQCLVSAILAAFIMKPGIWPPLLLAMLGILCREIKNKGRNSVSVGV